MGESDKILDITKALSDELRLDIVRALVSGKPRRYTDIMNDLGMDVVTDSSKFAYHIGVLIASGILEKHGDGYAITPGGKEVLQGMTRISQGWGRFGYTESLKKMTGHDIIRVTWARTLLAVGSYWLLIPIPIWYGGKYGYAPYMTLVGLVALSMGVYLIVSLRDVFDNDLWKTFFSLEACKSALGENGYLIDRIKNLGIYSNLGLALIFAFISSGPLVIGPLTLGIISMCLVVLFISVYWSRMLPLFWDQISEIKLALDFEEKIDFQSRFTSGFQVVIGTIFITFGASQLAITGESAFGYLGMGVGCLVSAVKMWISFRRKYYGLIQ